MSALHWLHYLQSISNEQGGYLGNGVQEVDTDRTRKLNRIDSKYKKNLIYCF